MIGDFFESFGKEKDEQRELPQEVVEALNALLPDNFEYVADENGNYRAVPKAEKVLNEPIKLTTRFDTEKVPELWEKLKKIPRDKWDEYLYRTQTGLPIKGAEIGDENKMVPIEILSVDPLHSDGSRFMDGIIHPYAFPDPIKMTFESPEGDSVQISIQQQAHDSVTEIKFCNVDFLALKIVLYQYSPLVEDAEDDAHTSRDRQLVVNYSVTPSKAASVKDAVTALHIFRGLINGETKVDSKVIAPEGGITKIDTTQVEDALNMWKTALELETLLNVSFDPGAEFPNEDVQFFAELETCLLEGKAILWRHPFDHCHIGGFHPAKEGLTFEDVIGNESIRYEFIEGPIPATLLGTEFNLYSRTEMKDFVITNIEWDDESHEKGEVYIADVPDKQWCLTRLYMTEEGANKYKTEIDGRKGEKL